MGKNILLIGLAVIVLIVAGVFISRTRNDDSKGTMNMASPSPTSGEPVSQVQTQSGNVAVNIVGFAFGPDLVKITKGSTVTWTNSDDMAHSIVSVTKDVLSSPTLSKGQTYSHTFNEVGTFSYHCGVHPYMQGTVQVVE